MDWLMLLLCASVRLCVSAAPLQSDDAAQRIARDFIPRIEREVGLRFRRPPQIATRSREQVRAFLDRKLSTEFPPAELEAARRTYRAFRLVPDTLDLRKLILDLYGEQVAGFYDPDSSRLFVVRGADPQMVRLVMAHELVHALQDQYTNLNAILKLRRQNDRQMAGQAVMEGQAMVVSFSAIAPEGQTPDFSRAWAMIRQGVRQQQSAMPVFASAPLILQESVLFPYISGGEFIVAFNERRVRPEDTPFNERLPISTEQILHPAKYTAGERPADVTIAPPGVDTLIYEDNFGEFETRVVLRSWGEQEGDAVTAASGWNGDRYQVIGSRSGTAIIWAVAFDTPADAAEFETTIRRAWPATGDGVSSGRGRRFEVATIDVSGVKVVRFVDAPATWIGWRRLPVVRIGR